jgi:hypothetical protein
MELGELAPAIPPSVFLSDASLFVATTAPLEIIREG